MPSFDIVSEVDAHEVSNAFDQAKREVKNRYDFQGTDTQLEEVDSGFKIVANSEDRVVAAYSVLEDKFIKRKISLKFLDKEDPQPAGGSTWSLSIKLKKGIDKENAKKIVALIKKEKSLKVTPAIQGDAVRVTGKKRDDLQACIQLCKDKGDDFPLALAYQNFRD